MANVVAQGSIYGLSGFYYDELALVLESPNPRLCDLLAGGALTLMVSDEVVVHFSGLPVAAVELSAAGGERSTRLIFDVEDALSAFETIEQDNEEGDAAQTDLFIHYYPAS